MVKACSINTINQLKSKPASALPNELLQGLLVERLKRLDGKYPYEMLGINELKEELNCGRDAVYKILSAQKIKSNTIGNKRMVTKLALAAYLVNSSI